MSYTVEHVIGVGQVAALKEICGKLEEARTVLHERIIGEQLTPMKSCEYHLEAFALSSQIYARASAEIMDDEEITKVREKNHAA